MKKHKHLMSTEYLDKKCRKCGTWKLQGFKCSIPGCKEKKVDVFMCSCTYRGLIKRIK